LVDVTDRNQPSGFVSDVTDVEDGVQRQGTLGGEIGQSPSGHVFHRDEAERRAVVLDFVDLVDDRNIRMGKRGAGPRFRQQPARCLLGVARRPNDFQRDGATETLVLGAIHIAHRAGTKASDQAIARQGFANHPNIMEGLPRFSLLVGC